MTKQGERAARLREESPILFHEFFDGLVVLVRYPIKGNAKTGKRYDLLAARRRMGNDTLVKVAANAVDDMTRCHKRAVPAGQREPHGDHGSVSWRSERADEHAVFTKVLDGAVMTLSFILVFHRKDYFDPRRLPYIRV